MIKKPGQFFISLLCGIFVVYHCLAITMLVIPNNAYSDDYHPFVAKYALPFFPQVWLLFGPQFQAIEHKIYFRCQAIDDSWTAWQDHLDKLISASQESRLSSYGYLYRIADGLRRETHNSLIEIESRLSCKADDENCQNELKSEWAENAFYINLKRIIGESCHQLMGGQDRWQKADFQFVMIHTKGIGEESKVDPEDIETRYFEPFNNSALTR